MRRSLRIQCLLVAAVVVLATQSSLTRRLCAESPTPTESKPTADAEVKSEAAAKPDAAGRVKSPAKPKANAKVERSAAEVKAKAKVSAVEAMVTPEREAAAIAFATRNHPELATLLGNLKQNNPAEYQAAVVDLDRIVERLAALKQKNVAQHDLELAHWQRDSRIRLLAARLTMSDNPALEAELKAAVREKLEQTLTERMAERERLLKRAEKLDQSIGELTTKLDELAEKEYAALRRSARFSQPSTDRQSNTISQPKPKARKSELKPAP